MSKHGITADNSTRNKIDHPLLLLASASPRRLALLEQIQVPVQQLAVPSPAGEDEPRHTNETVIEYVTRTADDKLQRAQAHLNIPVDQGTSSYAAQLGPAIITADTTVALAQEVLGKPVDGEDAALMLAKLSNKTHDVYTAVDLYYAGKTYRALSHSKVTFGFLTDQQIKRYVDSHEPFGKAGAYAIQGIAAQYIQKLEGSFSGVMGLPLYETVKLLRQAGLLK